MTNCIKYAISALLAVSLMGCASYRTNSNLDFSSTEIEQSSSDIRVLEGDLSDMTYSVIGPIEAQVKKLTLFHKDPTKEQVDLVLVEKAKEVGANAVINVSYSEGAGLTTWGYIKAEGTAVKTEQ